MFNEIDITMNKFEIVVIGGGIAGLATAEIFSRSGFKVLLIEKNSKLCSETSGLHHEWFHFGSLYSIFLNNQFLRTMVRGIGDLLEYYQDFEGMNLSINESGKLLTANDENGWFRNDKLQYVITTTSHPEFALSNRIYLSELFKKAAMRISWNMLIKRFIARHNYFYGYDWRKNCVNFHPPNFSFFDCSDEYVSDFSSDEINLNPIFHKSMESYDCPMNAYSIISDLTKSFLSNQGQILTDVMLKKHQKLSDKILVKLSNNQLVETKKLILSSGTHLKNYTDRLKLRIVASPLLIAHPAVCSVNFVRLTPFVSHTINHIKHNVNGVNYSLIGGGYFSSGSDEKSCQDAESSLLESAKSIFPSLINKAQLIKAYSGYKTEVSGSLKKRNYLYHIEEIEKDLFVILPAKFSLAFSLAVNAFSKITGRLPEKKFNYDKSVCVSNYVALMKHKAIVKEFYETSQN